MDPLIIVPWLAVVVISSGYLAQIIKIQAHREVRDLSWLSYLAWGIAYSLLAYEAYLIDSNIFIFKNVLTFLFVCVILAQIYHHRDDEWHDGEGPICVCSNELEDNWKFCPDCGVTTKGDERITGKQ
jgi:uncharacterized protein with PQ loop repeat